MVSIKDSFSNPPKPVNMEVSPANQGNSFVLNNLYYATNSADLKPESFIVLDAFAEYLKKTQLLKLKFKAIQIM